MIMLGIFVIVLMGYLRSKNDDDFVGAMAVATYSTFVIGFMFFIIDFLDGWTFGVIIAGTLISSAILFLDRRGQ